jgi:hypothetical protein
MIPRFPLALSLAAMATIAVACDRTESTSNAPVTTTSPAGTSTAPSAASARHRDEALVRVVNAAPSGSHFDLFAGDLLLFDGLSFKAVTPYRAVDGQRYAFALRPAGMTQAKPLASNTEGLQDGEFYTAIAMPGDGQPRLRVVNDRHVQPAAGRALVRVIHAGADAGRIHVRAAGATDKLFDGVDYQAVTDYRDATPVSGAIEIVGDGQAAPVLVSFNTRIDAGRIYTIVIVGGGPSGSALEAFLIEDALSP